MAVAKTRHPNEPICPLREIRLDGLFGKHVPLRLTLDERATILTGENGSGKSTILQAVHYISSAQWNSLSTLPVASITLVFRDGTELLVEVISEGSVGVRCSRSPRQVWKWPSFQPSSSDHATTTFMQEYSRQWRDTERRMRELERRLRSLRLPPITQREAARYERDYRDYRDLRDLRDRLVDQGLPGSDAPEWLSTLLSQFDVKMISARRLELHSDPRDRSELPSQDPAPSSVVEEFALELSKKMTAELSRYASESRGQERELPSRIVEAMGTGSRESLNRLASTVDELRSRVRGLADSLARVGLLQDEDPEQQVAEYPRNNAHVLLAVREVYRVAEERLQRLTPLRAELELLREFMNQRLTFKRLDLNPTHGIEIVLNDGTRIGPSQLSSGEQQLLALGFEIVFRTEPGSLVLIDEPELSLHVSWLQGLLSTLIEMASDRRLQFLIATHSPSVLAGNRELERSLDELTR